MAAIPEPEAGFFVAGGTLSAQAGSYVERAADGELLSALLAGRFCYVLNSRQMGKSSLCARTMQRLSERGVRTAFVDLTRIGGNNVTPDQWFAGIAVEIGRSLSLRSEILRYWRDNSEISPVQRLFGAIREVVLENVSAPVAVFFDEIDATRSLQFSADEFFAAIRECYNRRVQDPAFERLTFCLLGVAVPSDLVHSPTSTPFNVGERVYLRDFTLDEAMALAEGIRRPNAKALLERAHYWTNGHPYLTQSLCNAIAMDEQIRTADDVDALVRRDLFEPKARETNINLSDVANRALHAGDLESDPEKFRADLLSAYQRAWKGKPLADDESNRVAALLKLSGMMRSEGKQLLVRNRIYRHVFDKAWVLENMPHQELRRQRRSFWLGALRTAIIALAVVTAIGWLAWRNSQLAVEAAKARDRAEYQAYLSSVNLMRTAYDGNDLALLRKLLNQTASSRYKNLEWYYWNNLLAGPRLLHPDSDDDYCQLAPDGKSIALQNMDRRSLDIYSLPDDRLIAHVALSPTEGAEFAAGQWCLDGTASSKAIPLLSLDHRPIGVLDLGDENGNSGLQSINDEFFSWACADSSTHFHDIAIFDLRTLKKIDAIHTTDEVHTPFISGDGRFVAWDTNFGSENGQTMFHIYDRVKRSTIGQIFYPDTLPFEWVFSPQALDGKGDRLAAGFSGGRALVWDTRIRRVLFDKVVSDGPVMYVTTSWDGNRLLTMGTDLAARVWDVSSGSLILEEKGASASSLSLDGRLLAVGGAGTRVYPVQPAKTQPPKFRNAWILENRSDGTLIVGMLGRTRLVDPKSMRILPEHVPDESELEFNSFSGDGQWTLRNRKGERAAIVDAKSGQPLYTVTVGPFTSFDVNSKRMAMTLDASFQNVRFYGPNGKQLWTKRLDTLVYIHAWSPDEKVIALGETSGAIILVDAATGRTIRTFDRNATTIRALAFSHNGKWLAAGDDSRTIVLYQVDGSQPPMILAGHAGTLSSVAFSPDDTRLLSSSLDRSIRLWDTSTGQEMLRIKGKMFRGAVFDAAGQSMFSLDAEGNLIQYPMPH